MAKRRQLDSGAFDRWTSRQHSASQQKAAARSEAASSAEREPKEAEADQLRRASGIQAADLLTASPQTGSLLWRCGITSNSSHQGDPIVVETIGIEAASLREVEARAHAHLEDINLAQMGDGFRILQDHHVGEDLRWLR
jgi:hypothetical protein